MVNVYITAVGMEILKAWLRNTRPTLHDNIKIDIEILRCASDQC
jgi:hypothetical protein